MKYSSDVAAGMFATIGLGIFIYKGMRPRNDYTHIVADRRAQQLEVYDEMDKYWTERKQRLQNPEVAPPPPPTSHHH